MTKVTLKAGFLIKLLIERLVLIVVEEMLIKKLKDEIYNVFIIARPVIRMQ